MRIRRYNEKNITDISLTCFCDVIAYGEYLIFVNRITALTKKKFGNKYINGIIAEKMNSRAQISAFENLLSVWRGDYIDVIGELKDDGYFE